MPKNFETGRDHQPKKPKISGQMTSGGKLELRPKDTMDMEMKKNDLKERLKKISKIKNDAQQTIGASYQKITEANIVLKFSDVVEKELRKKIDELEK